MIAYYLGRFTGRAQLFRQVEDYFFRGISLKCLSLNEWAIAYMTGVQVANLNLVYIQQNTINISEILTQSAHFYEQENLDFVVIVPQYFCTIEAEDIFKAMNYKQTDKSVAMAITLEHFAIDDTTIADDEAIIARNSKITDWMTPLIGAFGSTLEICSQYANTHERALKNKLNLHHFSVYKQGKPISSITLSIYGNIARIDDVGTLPEFQGKGYATRLIKHSKQK